MNSFAWMLVAVIACSFSMVSAAVAEDAVVEPVAVAAAALAPEKIAAKGEEKTAEKTETSEKAEKTVKTEEPEAEKAADAPAVIDGQELFFVLKEPGKMSGNTFSASTEDRKALPQSVYNWVLNNLGTSKNCTNWVENFCSEDFNLVSYDTLKDTKNFVILQRQFSLRQERMVYYVLSADGELQQMQLSRDEKIIIKPTSTVVF